MERNGIRTEYFVYTKHGMSCMQCLYGVVRTNWSIDTMQQHSKEATELLYMISPLSTQMENMQNNTEGEYFWCLCKLN